MITLPTLSDLNTSYIADIEAKYGDTLPSFGKSFLRMWAGVQSGMIYLLYLALGRVQKNIFVDTCDYETLVRFGRVKLGRNPFPAISGEYTVNVTGTLGAIIPASTTFKSDDDSANPGFLFVLDNAFTMPATTGTITLRALEAGTESKLEIGNTLTSTAPISLVDSTVTVATESVAPKAKETEEDYRRKVLDAFRLEPQGGSGADYRLWASEVSGVEQVYPYANLTHTEVNLYVEANMESSSDDKGTPTAALLSEIEDSIEDPTSDRPSRKPLLDVVNYLPITPKDITISIADFDGITSEQQTAIFNSIKDSLSKVRPFVGSIDVLSNKNDNFGPYQIISIILSLYPGSSFGTVLMEVDSVSVTDFTFSGGNIPHLESITYV